MSQKVDHDDPFYKRLDMDVNTNVECPTWSSNEVGRCFCNECCQECCNGCCCCCFNHMCNHWCNYCCCLFGLGLCRVFGCDKFAECWRSILCFLDNTCGRFFCSRCYPSDCGHDCCDEHMSPFNIWSYIIWVIVIIACGIVAGTLSLYSLLGMSVEVYILFWLAIAFGGGFVFSCLFSILMMFTCNVWGRKIDHPIHIV